MRYFRILLSVFNTVNRVNTVNTVTTVNTSFTRASSGRLSSIFNDMLALENTANIYFDSGNELKETSFLLTGYNQNFRYFILFDHIMTNVFGLKDLQHQGEN